MRRDYDVFEKFPDGSTLWRACVSGKFEAERKMREMREHSENEFFTLDIQATFLPPKETSGSGIKAKAATAG
jgi:hypothetical protein